MKHLDIVNELSPFVAEVSGKENHKAVIDMARAIAAALAESEVALADYVAAYKKNEIFDAACLLGNHDNIFDFAKQPYLDFCKVMFELRPIGMGTPNAAVGEGEFMALFCSPQVTLSKKKGQGDLIVNGKRVELKGNAPRIFGEISGIALQKHATEISQKYGISPNNVKGGRYAKGKRYAFEPWSKNAGGEKAAHWKAQFARVGVTTACNYLSELCSAFIRCEPSDFACCFDDEVFNVQAMERLILKRLYSVMEKGWDAFTIIENQSIKCLPGEAEQFDAMVDEGRIRVTDNYFRSFQDAKIGLYFEIVKSET